MTLRRNNKKVLTKKEREEYARELWEHKNEDEALVGRSNKAVQEALDISERHHNAM